MTDTPTDHTATPGLGPRPPGVDALARSLADSGLPQPLLVDVARQAIAAGDTDSARHRVTALARSLLGPVVNATGVLLHTNLGRAPLAVEQAAEFTNLELDVSDGARGSRQDHAGRLLARAAGTEAALVVNNGAAAVMLVLAALAPGRGVAVSRGELIQLGGGFRLPDVMAQSGATLVEVGTTNRTSLADYEAAVRDPGRDVALVMKVHQSNYRIVGFTESAAVAELSHLGVPVVVDLGSGLLDARTPWLSGPPPAWLRHEPAVRQSLETGADLVTFSGDKLLGGPQAGIIAGRADLVARCGAHPLYRAIRPGGLVLAALQDVALHYLGRTAATLPFWQMATASVEGLRQRAERIAATPGFPTAVGQTPCTSVPGGGTVPGGEIPSWGFALVGDHTEALRAHPPIPIIARVIDGRTVCDLRTVLPHHDPALAAALGRLG